MHVWLLAPSCPTLWDPMDFSQPSSSVHGDSPGKNTRVGCHALLQGIFLTLWSNPGLPHWRQILYHPSHQGTPKNAGVDHLEKIPFSRGSSWPRNQTGVKDTIHWHYLSGENFVKYIQALKISKFFYLVISFLEIYLKKIIMNFHKDLRVMISITAFLY